MTISSCAETQGLAPAAPLPDSAGSSRISLNFNNSWAFHRGEVLGGERVALDDSQWAAVTLPHSLRLERKDCKGGIFQGIGWYRRYFTVGPEDKGKQIHIDFEGVQMDSDVYLNGEKIASRHGGYMEFSVDISGKVLVNATNVLAVRVSNLDNPDTPPGKPQKKLDFEYFGGIYRNVTLRIQDALRITNPLEANQIAGGGVFVTYPEVTSQEAVVHVQTNVANNRPARASFVVKTTLRDLQGTTVADETSGSLVLVPGQNLNAEQDLTVKNPSLWHPDHPHLYRLVSELIEAGHTVDHQEIRIGIRKLEFKPDGFYLNREKLYLRGGNRHQQMQNIGDAAPDSMQQRDALLLKADGFNAVRAAHYPHSPAFLDACDKVGLLVIECQPGWQQFTHSTAFYDHTVRDTREMIRRDRNHPSVFLWETALNETSCPDQWYKDITDAAHQEYPGDQLFLSTDYAFGGRYYNVCYKVVYQKSDVLKDTDSSKPFITREWGDWGHQARLSDGEPALLDQVVARQTQLNGHGYDDWGGLDRCPRIAGYFLWSWMDYAAGSRNGIAPSGAVDLNRYPKFCHYWLKSMTDARNPAYGPMVYIANYHMPTSPKTVMVYSNCDSVRLYQNENLIGEITRRDNASTAPSIAEKGGSPYYEFHLPSFQPGVLKAEGFLDGKVAASCETRTPGKPSKIEVVPSTLGRSLIADGSDLMPVYFKVEDENGTLVPNAGSLLHIDVGGAGRLVGHDIPRVGIENQAAIAGLGFAFIRSTAQPGAIHILAESPGLTSGEADLSSIPATCRFVPDGTHADWKNSESIFENSEADTISSLAGTDIMAGLKRIPNEQIDSISASCPSPPGRGTDKLVDGITDFGTGWIASSTQMPQSITVHFKVPENLAATQIFWEKDSTWYVYDVETSADGILWKKVADSKSVTGMDSTPQTFPSSPGTQFVRMTVKNVKAGSGNNFIGITETKFYEKHP